MVERKKQRLLRQIIGSVRDRKFDYVSKEPKKRDWFRYDRAQCREVVEMLDLIKLLVDAAEKRVETDFEPEEGRPPIARPADVAKVMLMQSYFQVANRPAEGLTILFSDRLGLSTEFGHKTLERGYDNERVRKILDEVFRLTNEPVKLLETISSIDGSGYPTSHKINYSNDREEQRNNKKSESDKFASNKKHDYVYNSAVIGATYEIYSAWVPSTDHSIGELSLFPETFEMCQQNAPETKIFLGDGLYAVRDIVQTIANTKMTPITLPRRNTAFKKKGCLAWIKLLEKIVDNPQAFLETLHNRSISETGFSTDKRKNTRPILKKLDKRRETESFLRGTNHNIKQLNYLQHTMNLEIINPIINAI